MTKYRVIQAFTDAVSGKVYQAGDKYPANAKKERINELLSDEHKNFDSALIEVAEDDNIGDADKVEDAG